MPSLKQQIAKNIDKTNGIKHKKNVEFKSTNNLPFETAPHFMPEFVNFRVGTCTGIYCSSEKNYMILAIGNSESGNGHIQDVFDWFENSCKRDKKNLMIIEIMNPRFMKHLIEKRNFIEVDKQTVIKNLKDIK